MSNKKYTNYNNKFQGSREAVNPIDESAEAVIDEVVVENNDTVEEAVVTSTKEVSDTLGFVVEANKLNVRKHPEKGADVLCVIPNGSQVKVDLEKSTLEWYHVVTSAGIEGFCMKNFVAIN